MFQIQHRTRQLWESTDHWVGQNRRETVARCVEGINRIVAPTMGDGRGRKREDYRIVELDARERTIAIYDSNGKLTERLLADGVKQPLRRTHKKRQLVRA